MAKKRLNKKVALIGSVAFILLAVMAIGMFLYLSRDPEKFIQDAAAAAQAASQATDPNEREELYKEAGRNYTKAYGLAKTDELKVEILYRAIDEVYIPVDKWREAVGSWNQIVRLDPKQIPARYARLKYFYMIAQESPGMVWQEVATQAQDFIAIIEKADADPGLAASGTEKWEVEKLKQKNEKPHRLGPYLYLIRGTANLMNAQLGSVTNREETLRNAIEDLQKVKQMQPDDVDIYQRLAQAASLNGSILEAKGVLDARKTGQNEAIEILKEGIEATNNSIEANINLLGMKHRFSLTEAAAEPNQQKAILALEPEYLATAAKFSSSPEMFYALTDFYSDYRLGPKYLDKAIETIEKAIELDRNNVDYATVASNLYTRRYRISGQKEYMDRAIEITNKALLLPDAQATTGPGAATAQMNQVRLNSMLIDNYVDLILDSPVTGEQERRLAEERLAKAETAARQIEQVFRSGEEPQVIEWQGMVELAGAKLGKGDVGAATRKLYKVYTQFKVSGRPDPRLSYKLAKVFANSSESGAAAEFLSTALRYGIETTQPQAWLDYTDILLRANLWRDTLVTTGLYEERYGPTDRSRTMWIKAHIGAGEFAEAERYLEQLSPQDPNRMVMKAAVLEGKVRQIRQIIERRKEKLRTTAVAEESPARQQQEAVDPRSDEQLAAEMKSNLSAFIEDMDKMAEMDPNLLDASTITVMCGDAIATGHLEEAKLIVDKVLKYNPDNLAGHLYKRLFAEEDPAKVSAEKMKKLREDVLSGITDPVNRAASLGTFYQTIDEPNKAVEQFKKLVSISGKPELASDEATQKRAAIYLFDIALEQKDWAAAERLAETAKRGNFDECSGEFFAARVALAKEQYQTALASIENALAQRPVFGYGYMLRSRINSMLGKDAASIEDIKTAASMNPFDKSIARELANRLYTRNRNLGDNVMAEQISEAKIALDRARMLNPGDVGLASFYAEYISDTDPQRALAMRQALQENVPSLQNALLLARLAMRLSLESADTQKQQALQAMAAKALEQAKSFDPQNPAVLESYAEYYRVTGQQEKAGQMLTTAPALLWRHYVRMGQFDEAGKVLKQEYEKNPKDADTLRGLLFLAETSVDKQAVTKYGEELLSAEQNADNHLLFVQTCLNTGLTKEAEQRLASFRERYPQDGRGLLLASWLSMKQGRLKEALETVNKRLENDQADATAWRLRGQINSLLTEYDQAISDLQQSKTLMDSSVTRLSLAKAYLKTKRNEDAITELKSIADDPGAPDEARILLERVYMRTGRREALSDFYAKILEKMPDNVSWNIKAAGFEGASGNFDKAEEFYSKAFQKSVEQGMPNPDALSGYMRAILAAGKTDKLLEEAQKHIDGNLATVAYYWMAQAKMNLGDRKSAIDLCEKALLKARNSPAIIEEIVQKMASLIGVQDTERVCQKMMDENKDGIDANWAMFNLCFIKGDYNAAIDYIDKCINTTSKEQNQWVVFNSKKAETLAVAFMKTSDNNYLNSALGIYEALLEKMPNNTSIMNNVAYILADNNKELDKALEYSKMACEAKPDDPEYLDTYALVMHKKGRNTEAVEYAQAAIQQYETQQMAIPAEAYEHLGQFHEAAGEQALARSAYEQALEVGGENMQQAVKQRIIAAIERLRK